jgi:hypothetical protein
LISISFSLLDAENVYTDLYTPSWGYVYRGETKHFNYLANYPLPVIIILCDPATKEAYWVRFDVTEAHWTCPLG